MNEIVYVLVNESMPGYVKIGRTSTDLAKRIKELSTFTSIPLPFTCFYACTVEDAQFVEHQLHDAFDNNRVNPKREFFEIAPARVVAALKLAEIENVTPRGDLIDSPEDRQAVNQARIRRVVFNFDKVNIPVGSELIFSRDQNIKARVIDNRHIEYNNEITSLSTSAEKILNCNYSVAGTDYWMYEGETLDERRRRIESED